MSPRNLVLIHRGPRYERDFQEIAEKVNALDRSITVYHLPSSLDVELPVSAWQHPTLTVSITETFRLPIRRGPVLRNAAVPKLVQQEIFRRNGIATPPAMPFRFGMKLDPILFGEFVVLKTANLNLTSKGANLHLFRRSRAQEITSADFPSGHPLRRHPDSYLVQRFIDTGSNPAYYRAAVFMNRILYVWHTVIEEARPPLSAPDHMLEQAVIDIKGGTMRRKLVTHEPVLEAARKAAAAFPDVPLLAIDLVVQQDSGKIWVLEVNAGGNSWHFSSSYGKGLRRNFGLEAGADEASAEEMGRLQLIGQFNAFDVAAEALVSRTISLAG
jgi:hypothetical protein